MSINPGSRAVSYRPYSQHRQVTITVIIIAQLEQLCCLVHVYLVSRQRRDGMFALNNYNEKNAL